MRPKPLSIFLHARLVIIQPSVTVTYKNLILNTLFCMNNNIQAIYSSKLKRGLYLVVSSYFFSPEIDSSLYSTRLCNVAVCSAMAGSDSQPSNKTQKNLSGRAQIYNKVCLI